MIGMLAAGACSVPVSQSELSTYFPLVKDSIQVHEEYVAEGQTLPNELKSKLEPLDFKAPYIGFSERHFDAVSEIKPLGSLISGPDHSSFVYLIRTSNDTSFQIWLLTSDSHHHTLDFAVVYEGGGKPGSTCTIFPDKIVTKIYYSDTTDEGIAGREAVFTINEQGKILVKEKIKQLNPFDVEVVTYPTLASLLINVPELTEGFYLEVAAPQLEDSLLARAGEPIATGESNTVYSLGKMTSGTRSYYLVLTDEEGHEGSYKLFLYAHEKGKPLNEYEVTLLLCTRPFYEGKFQRCQIDLDSHSHQAVKAYRQNEELVLYQNIFRNGEWHESGAFDWEKEE